MSVLGKVKGYKLKASMSIFQVSHVLSQLNELIPPTKRSIEKLHNIKPTIILVKPHHTAEKPAKLGVKKDEERRASKLRAAEAHKLKADLGRAARFARPSPPHC